MTMHVSFTTRPAPVAPACSGSQANQKTASGLLQARIDTLETTLRAIAESAAEASMTASGVAVYDLGNIERMALDAIGQP